MFGGKKNIMFTSLCFKGTYNTHLLHCDIFFSNNLRIVPVKTAEVIIKQFAVKFIKCVLKLLEIRRSL